MAVILYDISYEICALIFLSVVAVHFFSEYRFPSITNLIFKIILGATFFYTLLDIATAYTISYNDRFSFLLNLMLNQLFFMLLIFLAPLIYLFILSLTDKLTKKNRVFIGISFLPWLALFIIWVLNPIRGGFFTFDIYNDYIHGPFYYLIFIISAFYLCLALCMTVINRKVIQKKQFVAIFMFSVFFFVALSIQYYNPSLLLSGMAACLAVVMVYLTLQNPADMLDDLTGCLNRTALLRFIKERMKKKACCNAIIVSLDDLPEINKLFGMDTGNEVLFNFAKFLKGISKKAFVFRLMGDTFIIATDKQKECFEIKDIISGKLKTSSFTEDINIKISATLCYTRNVRCPAQESDVMLILLEGLQAAKSKGKGSVFEISQAFADSVIFSFDMRSILKETLEKQDLQIWLQPIFSPATGKIIGAEALSRILHPEKGIISPADFIPLAEKTGMITEISRQVLEKICSFIKEHEPFRYEGFECISMNLSAADIMQNDFPVKVNDCIEKHDLVPGSVIFEITETAAALGSDTLKNNMEKLCEKNHEFAIDDFGTGYSNLSTLTNLPFLILKTDRSVMPDDLSDKRQTSVFMKLIDLFKGVGLDVIVEGVETKEQHDLLLRLGVKYAQGFYYARPMPMDEFAKFIKTVNS